jgi:hypothetical protein
MSEHLDLDALCDVLAGVATETQTTHAHDCADCRARLAELAGAPTTVPTALAGLTAPPIPDDLVARLDAALLAERTPKVATATVTPIGAAPSRRTRWLPWAGGVAAACALVLGFVALRSGGNSSSDSATSASRAESAQLPTSSTGNSYSAKGDLLAKALPQQLSGTADKVAAPADGAPAQGGTTGGAAVKPDALAPLRDQKTLASCLAGLTDPTDATLPLALDYASFDGQPALVVVYPTSKPTKVDVFVVGAGCTQADSKLLFFTRLTKP